MRVVDGVCAIGLWCGDGRSVILLQQGTDREPRFQLVAGGAQDAAALRARPGQRGGQQ